MKIETFPIIAGILFALLGFALIWDARAPDKPSRIERRRRRRRERNRTGETMIGLGIVALGVAVAGRDTWRYGILTMMVGAALVVLGAWPNRHYLGELLTSRGASRRRPEGQQDRPAPGTPPHDPDKQPRTR